jgi:DNA-binding transcriptional regulator YiaG
MRKKLPDSEVTTIEVYLERRKSRDYVGRLSRIKGESKPGFEFEYNEAYLLKKNSIPLGPEFPLTKRMFHSKKLFASFEDRIPSRENPAYSEYCESAGVSPNETDPLVLIATIGRRGPSSFVFERVKTNLITGTEIANFRQELSLTIREFAAAFGTSPASIQQLEIGKGSGKELLKRLEIYIKFPAVALYEVRKNRAALHTAGYQVVITRLEEKIKMSYQDASGEK